MTIHSRPYSLTIPSRQPHRFLVRRGVIHRQLGSYNEAVADLEKVCAPAKNEKGRSGNIATSPCIFLYFSISPRGSGRLDRAFSFARCRANSALVRRGVIHRELGRYNEAVADLDKVCPPSKEDGFVTCTQHVNWRKAGQPDSGRTRILPRASLANRLHGSLLASLQTHNYSV